MLENFLTWEVIGTYAGSIVATALITQWCKTVFRSINKKIPIQLLSFVIAVILLNISAYFIGGLTLSSAILTIPNGIIVSTASNGVHDIIKKTASASNTKKSKNSSVMDKNGD